MEIIGALSPDVRAVALLPAAFHPPTRAHEALLQAALGRCDAAIAVLPRAFPHKDYGQVGLDARLELLRPLVGGAIAAAISEGGLFLDMAREVRRIVPGVEVCLLCGRDAAERIVNWPYDGLPPMAEQLREYRLLVAARQGEFAPPPHLAHGIEPLALPGDFDGVSSTQVRQRFSDGQPWEHLVPEASVDAVRRLYSPLLVSRNARNL
ncbi:MAG: hypothetical protein IPJ98_18320 [Bryobacterales bacterium]|nr:hypothetical protein [Bryobacterales bacterium]